MEQKISRLIERYRDAVTNGKIPYFDTNELDDLLEYLESEEEYEAFNRVVELGRHLHPDNVVMQIQEARGYLFTEDCNKALTLIDAINGEGEYEDEIDLLRMECWCRLQEYDKVSKHLDELTKENCYYLQEAFEAIATILVDMCMDDEAFELINRGLKLFPNSFSLKDEKNRLMDCVDADKAIELQNKQIDEDPYDAESWNTAAQIYADKGDFAKAIEALCFASACNDSEPDTEMEMMKGLFCYMNGSYEAAIDVYKKINITPDMEKESKEIYSVMAKCYIGIDNYEEAYKCLKNIVCNKVISDKPIDYLNFIHCCIEAEHEKDLPKVLDAANRKFPNDLNVLSLLTATYMDIGRDADSKDTSGRLLKILGSREQLSKEDMNTAFSTGKFFCMVDETEEALKYFNMIKRFQPDHPLLPFYMALVQITDGTFQNFDEQYKQSLLEDLQKRLKENGFDDEKIRKISEAMTGDNEKNRVIPPEELTKEFLRNKGNIN